MYRATDPTTSRAAATELIASGKLSERRAQVLALVIEYPGSTHGELARQMYKTWPELGLLCCAETPHKRLKELEVLDLVYWMGERQCAETRMTARQWFPAKNATTPQQVLF